MTIDWQTGAAWLCIGIAAGLLVRRGWSFVKSAQSGCGGGCLGCEKTVSMPNSAPLVTLDLPLPYSIDSSQTIAKKSDNLSLKMNQQPSDSNRP